MCCQRFFYALFIIIFLAAAALGSPVELISPLSPPFTYQGRLDIAGGPANGVFDLEFSLFDAATDGTRADPVLCDDVPVFDGHFTVALAFDTFYLNGADRWLQLAVRPGDGTGDYTVLTPRQKLTWTPYAIFAAKVPAAGVDGLAAGSGLTLTDKAIFSISEGGVVSAMLADGAVLAKLLAEDGAGSGLDADLLDGLDSTAFAAAGHAHDATYFKQGGNAFGTAASLGTTDAQPLSLLVDNTEHLSLGTDFSFRFNRTAGLVVDEMALIMNTFVQGTTHGQSFTASADGTLTRLSYYLNWWSFPGTVTLYDGNGFGGAVLSVTPDVVMPTTGWQQVTLATPVQVTAGHTYTWRLDTPLPSELYLYFAQHPGQTFYKIEDGVPYQSDAYEYCFKATIDTARPLLVGTGGQVGIGTDSPGATLDVAGTVRASGVITSTVATGAAPLAVASTTLVANLNADTVDGLHAAELGGTHTHTLSALNGAVTDAQVPDDITISYASRAGDANTADSAEYAEYASRAGSANNAEDADYASRAGRADDCYYADRADHAEYADRAGSVDEVDYADRAGFANSAGGAEYAYSADHADDADHADNAYEADNADTLDYKHAADFALAGHAHSSLAATDGDPLAALSVDADGNVGIGTATPGTTLDVVGSMRASGVITSTVATGTAPLAVASSTLVANLNADLLDGLSSAQFMRADANTGTTGSLAVGGNLAINTDKFTVAAATGNTTIAGTLGVVGASTLVGTVTVGGDAGIIGGLTVGGVIASTVTDGAAPFAVASTTRVPGLNADLLDGQHAAAFAAAGHAHDADYFKQGGNAFDATAVLGTTDYNAMELEVCTFRALRLEPTPSGYPNLIGGHSSNAVTGDAHGATISGGSGNSVSASYATVGGGEWHTASGAEATISGGSGNLASGAYTTISGGSGNMATASYATIGGGNSNAAGNAYATIAGGHGNTADTSCATVGGGEYNYAGAQFATVPGGNSNMALGVGSFASGTYARANHEGAFVWADNSGGDLIFPSTDPNQFRVRSTGGAQFVTGIDGTGSATNGVMLFANSSGWSAMSDRNSKTNFLPIDARAIARAVGTLPITTWNYKAQDPAIRHIGPMAQDLYAAFGFGEDEKRINAIDADGVALAAIQGVYLENQALKAQVAVQQRELDAMNARLAALERLLAKGK